ncbi:hypothetical protein [Lyngbya confervoides]|uniref:Uncharacterized protein n=1 Tax=Lyngbya confervoides BDU141951 TaxID=1574623 RepID=A0ABD4SZE6_9CYAN|nr:hypothetical protein [Lyngbya confervoides]MCM1981682.1 hypothetical protein [Lyngbya confervoides BDU141951]
MKGRHWQGIGAFILSGMIVSICSGAVSWAVPIPEEVNGEVNGASTPLIHHSIEPWKDHPVDDPLISMSQALHSLVIRTRCLQPLPSPELTLSPWRNRYDMAASLLQCQDYLQSVTLRSAEQQSLDWLLSQLATEIQILQGPEEVIATHQIPMESEPIKQLYAALNAPATLVPPLPTSRIALPASSDLMQPDRPTLPPFLEAPLPRSHPPGLDRTVSVSVENFWVPGSVLGTSLSSSLASLSDQPIPLSAEQTTEIKLEAFYRLPLGDRLSVIPAISTSVNLQENAPQSYRYQGLIHAVFSF